MAPFDLKRFIVIVWFTFYAQKREAQFNNHIFIIIIIILLVSMLVNWYILKE